MPVVVGYVDSPEGRGALRAAVHEARARDGRVVVVMSAPRGGPAAELDAAADEVRAFLDDAKVQYEVRRTARSGDPAEDIVQTAQGEQAELVVIGLRRRSAVGRIFLGAKAQRILLDAPCPVLTVKSDAQD